MYLYKDNNIYDRESSYKVSFTPLEDLADDLVGEPATPKEVYEMILADGDKEFKAWAKWETIEALNCLNWKGWF